MIKCSHLTPKSIYSYIDDLVIANCLIDARVPRGQRSAAVPVTDARAIASAPTATAPVPPPAATPPAPPTSTDAFVLGVLSTPPPEDQA